MNTTNELEKLRDILYGEQMREVRERMDTLEARLQTLSEQIDGKLDTLNQENIQGFSQQTKELQRVTSEQNQKLHEQERGLSGKLEDIRSMLLQEIAHSQERDEALKNEIKTLLEKLEQNKVGRAQLRQALIEMGNAVQNVE